MYFGQQMFNTPNQNALKYIQVDLQRVYNVYHITYQCNREFKPEAECLNIEFKQEVVSLQMNSSHS